MCRAAHVPHISGGGGSGFWGHKTTANLHNVPLLTPACCGVLMGSFGLSLPVFGTPRRTAATQSKMRHTRGDHQTRHSAGDDVSA